MYDVGDPQKKVHLLALSIELYKRYCFAPSAISFM